MMTRTDPLLSVLSVSLWFILLDAWSKLGIPHAFAFHMRRAAACSPRVMYVRCMTQEPSLQSHLRAQFQLAFGPPHRTVGHDDQWQLDCHGTVGLNILVNGSPTQPAVWVFAAHDPKTGVFGKAITDKDEVPELIKHIQKRLDLPLPETAADAPATLAVSP